MNEAELLFTEILDCDRASLYLNKDLSLDRDKSLFISSALKRRIKGEPIQYILGKADFMGLTFKVNSDVLIPRPETEILVESVLSSFVARRSSPVNILDIGTGSGCIAISLAKLLKGANITATDISPEAIEVARSNAYLNGVVDKIRFIQSDVFLNNELKTMNYELIISNPPYIPSGEIDKLQPEVRHEPGIALNGGTDGLDFYRRIIRGSCEYLKEGGLLAMEMGFGQRKDIEKIIQKSGYFGIIDVARDYNDIERVVLAKRIKKYG